MCQNGQNTPNDIGIKKKGVLELDIDNVMLVQLEVFTKQLVGATIVQANVSQVQMLGYDLCGEVHENDNCLREGYLKEAYYVGNLSRGNIYFNTYNPGQKDHLNFKYGNKQSLNTNQRVTKIPPPRKPSQLK